MRFTDRLNLKLPEPEDSYNIQDFTDNFDEISKSFAGIPKVTNYLTLEEYIDSGTADNLKRGDVVAINSIFYILVGSDPLNVDDYMVYGAEALVVMREYVPIAERIKGSMYFQLGKTRRLIVKIFKKFFSKTKNLIPYPYFNGKSGSGITWTDNNGIIIANGTASGNNVRSLNPRIRSQFDGSELYLKKGTYILSDGLGNGTNTTFNIGLNCYKNGNDETSEQVSLANSVNMKTFEITEDDKLVWCYIVIRDGYVANNLTFKPMIRLASIADDTYEPYKKVEADASTLLFQKTAKKTTNISDGNKYRFTCKNLSILEDGDTSERVDGKIYFVAKQ